MTRIVWDRVGDRVYEGGISKGVLHLTNGESVPWNGLKSVSQKVNNTTKPIYFDGVRVNNYVDLGDFSGTITAITYPEEMSAVEGLASFSRGSYVGNQQPELFNLSYVTNVGTDLTADKGYKIHLLYNLTAIPSDKSYASFDSSFKTTDFTWEVHAVPEEVAGFRPTAEFVFDSRKVTAEFLGILEDLIYGTDLKRPNFPTVNELTDLILQYFILEIIDNGNGTWTATTSFDDLIIMESLTEFTIQDIEATYLSDTLYEVSSNR